jgi:hypothetical protein
MKKLGRTFRLIVSFIFVGTLSLLWIGYGAEIGAFRDWGEPPSIGALLSVALVMLVCAVPAVIDFYARKGRGILLSLLGWGAVGFLLLHLFKTQAPRSTAAESWWIVTGFPLVWFVVCQAYALRTGGAGEDAGRGGSNERVRPRELRREVRQIGGPERPGLP